MQDTSIPTVNAGPDKTICAGTPTTLTATGSGTYVWSYNNATTASITVTPSGTTTYTVTVTGGNGCTASDAAIVNVTPLPVSGITGPDEICVDEYALFTAESGGIRELRMHGYLMEGRVPMAMRMIHRRV